MDKGKAAVSATRNTIRDHVLNAVDRAGERPFLIDARDDRSLSYEAVHRLAAGIAAALRRRGLDKSDRIAILLENGIEFAVMYLACLYGSAVAVPVNPRLPQGDIDWILGRSGSRCLVYSPATASLIPDAVLEQSGQVRICLVPPGETVDDAAASSLEELAGAEAPGPTPGDMDEGDLYSISFTSGTTGRPRGVCHTVGSLLRSALAFNDRFGFDADRRFYHILPMGYMAGFLNTLLCPLMAGAGVVINRPFDPRMALDFWSTPIRQGVDTLWLVPTMLASLVRIDRDAAGIEYCRDRIRTVCVGTAPLSPALKRAFEEKYGVTVHESFGLTETLFVTTNADGIEFTEGSVGPPLPGVELRSTDQDGVPQPTGVDGQIWVRSPFNMAGYLDTSTLEPDPATSPEWFASGDLGRIAVSGHLSITGRLKDLIIRGGLNISPRTIEEVLAEHEAVEEAAVVGLPHELYGEQVGVALILRPGWLLEQVRDALEQLCGERLGADYIPARFFIVDDLPRSSTGKVQKARLRDTLLAQHLPAAADGSA